MIAHQALRHPRPTAAPRTRTQIRRHLALAGLGLTVLAAGACEDLPGPVVSATTSNDVAVVAGTAGDDVLTLRLRAGDPTVIEVDEAADGTADHELDRTQFRTIIVKGYAGDDVITVDVSNGGFTDTESTIVIAGEGHDTVRGANGAETLLGGPGDDVLDGGSGVDTLSGEAGADLFPWEPGDGNDRVTGGLDADRLAVTGGNVTERISFASTTDGHALVTRDVGNVQIDLDEVETLGVRPLGGADVVVPGDLGGTDVTTVEVDLAGSTTADDGAADSVEVPPGKTVGWDGPAATIGGFGPPVRVIGGTPTDQVHITGTPAADVAPIAGTPGDDQVNVVANGTDVAVFGSTTAVHARLTAIETLDVDLAAGADQFTGVGNLAALVAVDVDGGPGNDTILGTNGADLLRGGSGTDHLDGNQGTDTIDGGDDDDVIQWDPGDASDTVAGGAGADRLAFHGSNTAERLTVSPLAAGRARLVRDVASIILDLDDVETLELRALGGADIVTVDDLSGTDVTTVTADLNRVGGGGDGVADQVVVNATAGDDAVGVLAIGQTVQAQGLAAVVRVQGADATLDALTVQGLAGDDTLTASPAVTALLLVNLFD